MTEEIRQLKDIVNTAYEAVKDASSRPENANFTAQAAYGSLALEENSVSYEDAKKLAAAKRKF